MVRIFWMGWIFINMENKQKHLEFIQSAVARMSSNLFLLKGWTVTLIAALFALAAKDSNKIYFLISYLPALMFWTLDGKPHGVEQ